MIPIAIPEKTGIITPLVQAHLGPHVASAMGFMPTSPMGINPISPTSDPMSAIGFRPMVDPTSHLCCGVQRVQGVKGVQGRVGLQVQSPKSRLRYGTFTFSVTQPFRNPRRTLRLIKLSDKRFLL